MLKILIIENLTKSFDGQKILDNITYNFKKGFLYVIIGVSGSGKSTLLHIISGILNMDSGVIKLNNYLLTKKDVTPILQTAYLFGDLTVAQNILLPAHAINEESMQTAKRLMDLFKIKSVKNRQIKYCSGGERARTNLARGLINNTPVVVIDEPTAHVDYETAKLIVHRLAFIAQNQIIIVASHQPQLFNFSHVRMLYLQRGKLYEKSDIH